MTTVCYVLYVCEFVAFAFGCGCGCENVSGAFCVKFCLAFVRHSYCGVLLGSFTVEFY